MRDPPSEVERLRAMAGQIATLATLGEQAALLQAAIGDATSPSSPLRAMVRAAAGGADGYTVPTQLCEDLAAALQGRPLVHALGGQGRLQGFAAGEDLQARLLLMRSSVIRERGRWAQSLKPLMVVVSLLLLAFWFTWLVPFLRARTEAWRPAWAQRIGHDLHGRWAELDLAGRPLRFRLVMRGEQPRAGDLWVMDQEVPRWLWRSVADLEADGSGDLDDPVSGISHRGALVFCRRLGSQQSGFACRLPTRQEWGWMAAGLASDDEAAEVVAARGELLAIWQQRGEAEQVLAWWAEQGLARRRLLGARPFRGELPRRDGRGLADMVGNLAEWCEDPDPTKGEGMALAAGGSWFDPPERCRAGLRLTLAVTARDPRVGVRLVVPFVPPTTDDRP